MSVARFANAFFRCSRSRYFSGMIAMARTSLGRIARGGPKRIPQLGAFLAVISDRCMLEACGSLAAATGSHRATRKSAEKSGRYLCGNLAFYWLFLIAARIHR